MTGAAFTGAAFTGAAFTGAAFTGIELIRRRGRAGRAPHRPADPSATCEETNVRASAGMSANPQFIHPHLPCPRRARARGFRRRRTPPQTSPHFRAPAQSRTALSPRESRTQRASTADSALGAADPTRSTRGCLIMATTSSVSFNPSTRTGKHQDDTEFFAQTLVWACNGNPLRV